MKSKEFDDIEEFETREKNYILVIGFLSLIIAILFIIYFLFIKKHRVKESYDDASLDDIINIVKQHGGRTTQKEIRSQIPLSEAKICLMIAELEESDVLKKIKKGRGNIIILNK